MSSTTVLSRGSIFILCFLVVSLTFCCFGQVVNPAEAGQTAVVNGTDVNARTGPGTSYPVVGVVNTGESYPVLAKDGEWYKLRLKEGQAWVKGTFLKITDDGAGSAIVRPPTGNTGGPSSVNAAVCSAVVDATDVNLRFGPGTVYKTVGKVNKGDTFPVLAKSGDWYKLSVTGGTAWIAGWLIKIKDPPKKGTPVKGEGKPDPLPDPVPDSVPDPVPGGETGTKPETEPVIGTGGGNPEGDTTGGVADGSKVAVVSATNVNVRSGPGTDYRVIAMVNKGDNFTISGKSGEWYRLDLTGGSGWVAGWLLDLPVEVSRGGGSESPEQGTGKLSMEVSQLGGKAVISLKSSGKISHNVFTLTNPNRLVMDLTLERGPDDSYKDLPESVEINKGPVGILRTGWLDGGQKCLRIVLDLNDRAHYIVSEQDANRGLVLEVFTPDLKGALLGKTIFLDPGHGGNDPGAIGPTGLHESSVTIDIANRAAGLLREQGATVYMSRTGNTAVGQKDRAKMANNAKADIFVSIHINSNEQPDKWGMSTYYYSPPADKIEQAQKRKKLADSLQTELSETLRLADLGLFQARFAVLCETVMPAVLLEIGFISNPEEEKLLKEESFREQAAQAITRGLGYYFCQ